MPPLLFSYAYIRNSDGLAELVRLFAGSGKTEVLIDSGAFTVHRVGKSIDLQAYMAYCRSIETLTSLWGFIQLDVIGNSAGTRRNLDTMVAAGLHPLPVFTVDMDFNCLPAFRKVNRRICVAGALGNFSGHMDWVSARYRRAKALVPDAELHGLGFVRFPEMLRVGLTSSDSSSHSYGQRNAIINWYESGHGVHGASYRAVCQRPKGKLPKWIRTWIDGSGITAAQWRDEQWMTRGGISALTFGSVLASSLLASACLKKGYRCFQAVSKIPQVIYFVAAAKAHRGNGFIDFAEAKRVTEYLMALPAEKRPATIVSMIGDSCEPQS